MANHVFKFFRNNGKLLAVAAVMGVVGLSAPALASSVASFADNADKVDGKHAVGYGASTAVRKGKLVATSPHSGRLPNNIIARAPDSSRLGGKTAGAYLKKSQVINAKVTCAGTTYSPYDSTDAVSSINSMRYSTSNAIIRCNMELPNHAVVQAVSWGVRDNSAQDITCELWRTRIAGGTIGQEFNMADVSSADTPGDTRIQDATIKKPVVNNIAFSYFTQCRMGNTSDIGLYGSTVAYKIRADGGTPPVTAVLKTSPSKAPTHSGN